VVSVGFGQKHSGGSYRDDLAIIVYVAKKKSEDALAPEERIPATFEGYRTDVVEVPKHAGRGRRIPNAYSPIQGGIQIVPKPRNTQNNSPRGR
jgi:hypothetical protein